MRCLRHDCKAEFEPVRSNQVYCSPACKREMERRQRVANRVFKEIMEKGFYGMEGG